MTMATTTKTAVQVPCKDMALKAMEMDKRAEPATVVIPVCSQRVTVFNVCFLVSVATIKALTKPVNCRTNPPTGFSKNDVTSIRDTVNVRVPML